MHYVIILYIESKKMYIENFQFFYRYYCLIAEGYKIPSLTVKFIKTPLKALFYLGFSAVPFRFTI